MNPSLPRLSKALIVSLEASLFFFTLVQADMPTPTQDTDFYDDSTPDKAKVRLGKKLFFDKLLSGNLNISCATCHHPLAGTGDGLSLPVGEDGIGLGVTRIADNVFERVPRNAPPLFNLGAKEFTKMFHDGRVQVKKNDPSGTGFRTPAGRDLPQGLENVLAVQAMFPVTSATEMAGHLDENPQADAAAAGDLPGVWGILAVKLQSNKGYVRLFKRAFADIDDKFDITYVHAANAIAAFEASAWRFDDSPFDKYIAGDLSAMSANAVEGMDLFYGPAGCSGCHSGVFQTDQKFHAIGMPQIGPGKGHGIEGFEDFGRGAVTGKRRQRYKFRTPPLRNVMISAPYGHDGAYKNIRQIILHHMNPARAIDNYNTNQALLPRNDSLPDDFAAHNNIDARNKIKDANELSPMRMSNRDIKRIIDFLEALTDRQALDMRKDVPNSVPSGLPVFD